MLLVVLAVGQFFLRRFVEAFEDILRVNDGDNAIKVETAAEAFVHPKHGSNISRICNASGLEQNVVESTVRLTLDQRFQSRDTGVLDTTTDTAVGKRNPFLRLLVVLFDR